MTLVECTAFTLDELYPTAWSLIVSWQTIRSISGKMDGAFSSVHSKGNHMMDRLKLINEMALDNGSKVVLLLMDGLGGLPLRAGRTDRA